MTGRVRAACTVVALAALCGTSFGQPPPLSGYLQNVPLGGTAGGGLSDFNRFRLSRDPSGSRPRTSTS